MEVVIDGVRFVPETAAPEASWREAMREPGERIGVAVTTMNRPHFLADTLPKIVENSPENAVIVVVDDGSKDPVEIPDVGREVILHRFPENRGVAAAKNKCIELLMSRGVEHLFLFDDDTYPTRPDWWVPYVASPVPHLQYQFESGPNHWAIREVKRDEQHRVFNLSRGAMLYMTAGVVREIGGFHCAFGKRGRFHENFSIRANRAGLTPHPFMDVIAPAIYCRDQEEKGITSADHRAHMIWKVVAEYSEDKLPLYAEYHEDPVPVLVPRRADGGHRDKIWDLIKLAHWSKLDGYRVVEGHHVEGPLFNRAAAINTAARIAGNWSVAVIADSDIFLDRKQIDKAVAAARETGRLVAAFNEVRYLSEVVTSTMLRNKNLDVNSRLYKSVRTASETQSMCPAVPRSVFEAVGGFDPGYRGWGGEDNAFWHSATIVSGEPVRIPGPVYHMWHPPATQKREDRYKDPDYVRNWDRWCEFKKVKTVEEMRAFRRYE
jgi:glycosyltransferase involved in cell wall biosynthesis